VFLAGSSLDKRRRDGFNLGIENLGRKMASHPVEIIYEDDTQKPEIGKQKTDKLIEADHVNFLTGCGFSHVLLASQSHSLFLLRRPRVGAPPLIHRCTRAARRVPPR
jgi:hypothetical protein